MRHYQNGNAHLLINEDIKHTPNPKLESNDTHINATALTLHGEKPLHLISVYRREGTSPGSQIGRTSFEQWFENTIHSINDDDYVMCGDFNGYNYGWGPDGTKPNQTQLTIGRSMQKIMDSNDNVKLVNKKHFTRFPPQSVLNISPSMIDLTLTNRRNNITNWNTGLQKSSDHVQISFNINNVPDYYQEDTRKMIRFNIENEKERNIP